MSHPVYVGDTLWSESLVVTKRESSSRPQAGIVTIKTRTLYQDGVQVLSFLRTFYIHNRGAERAKSTFPVAKTPLVMPAD
jgi:itaconyl-CoA hydratase